MPDTILTIDGKRIQRFLQTAKTYVNTSLVPEGVFQACLGKVGPQDGREEETTGQYLQNLAVGVVHVQEIDFFTQHTFTGPDGKNDSGKAYGAPREGHITENEPSLALLSSPALNCGYGVMRGTKLSFEEQQHHIANMYRNLFDATLREGRNYFFMPAAGLGVFQGNPNVYFPILMQVAKEYPQLNIIYHPATKASAFNQAFAAAGKPSNVARARKDIAFLADEVNKQGYASALHNPSDCDAVYGVYDIGEYWKTGKGAGYVGEEHLGAMSTAPLNSYALNPSAYTMVVERKLDPKDGVANTPIPLPKKSHSGSLQDFVNQQEQNIGVFSKYGTVFGAGQDIPFECKPAQQFLQGLGCLSQRNAFLTEHPNGALDHSEQPTVSIGSFDPAFVNDYKATQMVEQTQQQQRVDQPQQQQRVDQTQQQQRVDQTQQQQQPQQPPTSANTQDGILNAMNKSIEALSSFAPNSEEKSLKLKFHLAAYTNADNPEAANKAIVDFIREASKPRKNIRWFFTDFDFTSNFAETKSIKAFFKHINTDALQERIHNVTQIPLDKIKASDFKQLAAELRSKYAQDESTPINPGSPTP